MRDKETTFVFNVKLLDKTAVETKEVYLKNCNDVQAYLQITLPTDNALSDETQVHGHESSEGSEPSQKEQQEIYLPLLSVQTTRSGNGTRWFIILPKDGNDETNLLAYPLYNVGHTTKMTTIKIMKRSTRGDEKKTYPSVYVEELGTDMSDFLKEHSNKIKNFEQIKAILTSSDWSSCYYDSLCYTLFCEEVFSIEQFNQRADALSQSSNKDKAFREGGNIENISNQNSQFNGSSQKVDLLPPPSSSLKNSRAARESIFSKHNQQCRERTKPSSPCR